MKNLLLTFLFSLVSFASLAQNYVGVTVGNVKSGASTKKYTSTIDGSDRWVFSSTGVTPEYRFTDFAGTGTKVLAVDADGDLVRTIYDPGSLTLGAAFRIPFINAGATDLDYSANFVWNNSGSYPTFNGVAPVSTSSGFALRNNAGTAIATIGVGSTSSTSSTWTGNTVINGDWDITGSLDVDNINVNGNKISTSAGGGDIQLDPDGSSVVSVFSNIVPETDDSYDLGSGTKYFDQTYTTFLDVSTVGSDFGILLIPNSISSSLDNTSNSFFNVETSTSGTTDSGTTPVMQFTSSKDNESDVFNTRPTFAWYNYTTKQMQLSASGNLSVFATTNQLVLGTTNTTTINSTAPAASRVATLSDFDSGSNSNIMQAATGTFTPTLTSSAGAFTTLTYSVQYGRYTRKQITSTIYETKVDISLTISALTLGSAAGGNLTINVPYNSITEANLIQVGQMVIASTDFDAGYTSVVPRILNASSSMQLRQVGDGVATAALGADDLTSTSSIQITLTYLSL